MHRVRIRALVFLLAAVPLVAFAQSGAAGRKAATFDITITANVAGATVTVDGKTTGTAPFTIALAAGDHALSVTARGYEPFSSTINVSKASTVAITLTPLAVRVSVGCNVAAADVTIAGSGKADVKGRTPFTTQLLPGSYTISLSAAGFRPYNGRLVVSMDSSQSYSFTLEAATVKVEIVTNVPASVNIMGGKADVSAQGRSPLTVDLLPDQYNVVLNAAGYQQLIGSLRVDAGAVDAKLGRQRVSFVLQAATATLNLVYSRQFLDPDVKDEKDARKQVKLFLDGKLQNPKGELIESLSVDPGKHRLRVTSGGLSFQTDEFDFQPGVTYTIELLIQLLIKTTPSTGR